jgi:DNA-binding beta-propeller fold protein YncE
VAVFNRKLRRPTRTIDKGLSGPDGEWVDASGDLYVANWQGPTIQEYAPRSSSPTFTYTTGLTNPINVVTDAGGNVYAVDYTGYVIEYSHRSNNPIQTYSINGYPEGAAFNSAGDLFVDYVNANVRSRFERFPHGSAIGKDIGPWFDWLGGLAIDKSGNLVVCSQLQGEVDVVAPPYKKVTRRLKHFTEPFHLSFNGSGNVLYIVDVGSNLVNIVDYSTGSVIKKLGPKNRLSGPQGVASSPELQ